MLPWQPVVDGDVIPGRPIDRIAAGAGAASTSWSARTPTTGGCSSVANGSLERVTDETLTGPVVDHGFETAWPPTACRTTALAAYRAAYPGASPGELLAAIETDWWCRIPALRLAEARMRRRRRPPTCTSSPGPRRRSAAASVPATRSRSASCSTRST